MKETKVAGTLIRPAVLLVAGAVLAAGQPSKRAGLEAVGLLGFAGSDVGQTGEIYKVCPPNRGCEIAFLAYSFTHSTSFANAETFVKSVLPSYANNQVLVVTMYLDDGANRDTTHAWCYFHPEWNSGQFWTNVRNGSLHTDWVANMARPAGQWIRSIKAWVNSENWGSRIRFIIVPVLEDGGASASDRPPGWAYVRLRDWTAEGIGDASPTYRRNSTTAHADRIPGVPMEFHQPAVDSTMLPGDVITADGVNRGAGVPEPAWAAVQASAHTRGLSALWWTGAFNNNTATRTSPPWQRGPLKPFTNNPNLAAQAKALIVAP